MIDPANYLNGPPPTSGIEPTEGSSFVRPEPVVTRVYNRSFTITADAVIPRGGAAGVILAQGSPSGGYTFFVKDNKLQFIYNYLGRENFQVTSNLEVPEGNVILRYEFEPVGQPDPPADKGTPALSQLYINKALVGAVQMPCTVQVSFGIEGLTCGYDGDNRVAPDQYPDQFPFSGLLKQVTLELAIGLIPVSTSDLKIAKARQ
jgi:uncharacterized protein YbbK (DUF523 family)